MVESLEEVNSMGDHAVAEDCTQYHERIKAKACTTEALQNPHLLAAHH
jgi:hypothetical protein